MRGPDPLPTHLGWSPSQRQFAKFEMFWDESFAWFKRPAHDAGKVLAIGAIAAVFMAWLFATAEYLPTPRSEDGRLNAQIGSIADAASQFDLLVQQ